jgi:hypothetical protein
MSGAREIRRGRSRNRRGEFVGMDTYTIPEAADATGLTPRAIRRRVEIGDIRVLIREGVRLIPRLELERVGLLEGDAGDDREDAPRGNEVPRGDEVPDLVEVPGRHAAPGGEDASGGDRVPGHDVAAGPREAPAEEPVAAGPEEPVAADLFARALEELERHAGEVGLIKALVARAESTCEEDRARLEAALHEARAEAHHLKARLAELEARVHPHRRRSARPALELLFEETDR